MSQVKKCYTQKKYFDGIYLVIKRLYYKHTTKCYVDSTATTVILVCIEWNKEGTLRKQTNQPRRVTECQKRCSGQLDLRDRFATVNEIEDQ